MAGMLPVSVTEAAARISASPAPVIFLDTCALLDVIRTPQRPEIRNEVIQAALALRQRTLAPERQVWIVTAPFVPQEWQEHSADTEARLMEHIKKLDEAMGAVRTAAGYLNMRPADSPQLATLKLSGSLRSLAQQLLDAAIVLREDTECIVRARARIAQARPPAAPRKAEFKDCEIIEHYLAVCSHLHGAGFAQRRVFVSSNKSDYCDSTGRLHPLLLLDFDVVNLQYAADFAWANALL